MESRLPLAAFCTRRVVSVNTFPFDLFLNTQCRFGESREGYPCFEDFIPDDVPMGHSDVFVPIAKCPVDIVCQSPYPTWKTSFKVQFHWKNSFKVQSRWKNSFKTQFLSGTPFSSDLPFQSPVLVWQTSSKPNSYL